VRDDSQGGSINIISQEIPIAIKSGERGQKHTNAGPRGAVKSPPVCAARRWVMGVQLGEGGCR